MVGVSIRHAQASGFHLRNEDSSVPLSKKKSMAQTWWALYSIECVLTSITGRPRVISRRNCTVPLLSSFAEERMRTTDSMQETWNIHMGSAPRSTLEVSTSSTGSNIFVDAWTTLSIIQHKILFKLYSPRTTVDSWEEMQIEIASLMTELNEWAMKALPQASGNTTVVEPAQQREQSLLYFYHQSVKICVTRSCLCRLDQHVREQNEESAEFNQRTADACIQAALDLTNRLPEPVNSRWFLKMTPWWSYIHLSKLHMTCHSGCN
jgi:hypothetical protein